MTGAKMSLLSFQQSSFTNIDSFKHRLKISSDKIQEARSYVQQQSGLQKIFENAFQADKQMKAEIKQELEKIDLKKILKCHSSFFRKGALLEQYSRDVKGFCVDDHPLPFGVRNHILTYIAEKSFDSLRDPRSPHQRTGIDVLFYFFQLNGKDASVIVSELGKFPKLQSIDWFIAPMGDDFGDDNNHGGKTSSVIASMDNQTLGILPGATIIPLVNPKRETIEEFLDQMETLEVEPMCDSYPTLAKQMAALLKKHEQGIDEWDLYSALQSKLKLAEEGGKFPHVINASISWHDFKENEKLKELQELFKEKDLLLVYSAGNRAMTVPKTLEDALKGHPELRKRILFVGALDCFGDVASFSNVPGTICPDDFIFAPGEEIPTLSYKGGKEENTTVDGTSFAAPVVSGTLALLKKYFPDFDMVTLKNIVLSTASPFPSYTGRVNKEIVGRGQLNSFEAFLKAYEMSH